jgi:cell division protein ZapA (FtsZ GTPase activity inhibitor)
MGDITITVSICDRPYRLKVNQEDEPKIREAESMINQRVRDYAKAYSYKDNQDLLAMVVLQFASQVINAAANQQPKQAENLTERIRQMEKIIVDTLED